MDLSTPILDGVEATRRIVAHDPKARVVILTSAASGRMVAQAPAAGAVVCLFKDAHIGEVLQLLRRTASSPTLGDGFPL